MRRFALGFLLLALASPSVHALAVPDFPTSLVEDQANLLNELEEQALSQKLLDLEQESGAQLGVLTVESLGGEALESYSLDVARTWALGSEALDNGLLLLVSVEDRVFRFEVGLGLEGVLPDALTYELGQSYLVPAFREELYAEGILTLFDAMIPVVQGEAWLAPQKISPIPFLRAHMVTWLGFLISVFVLLACGTIFYVIQLFWRPLFRLVYAFFSGLLYGLMAFFVFAVPFSTLVYFVLGGVLAAFLMDFVVQKFFIKKMKKNYKHNVELAQEQALQQKDSGSSSDSSSSGGGGSFGGGGSSGSW